jgi:hypothetical protein
MPQFLENNCKKASEYHSVDISKPSSFTTMTQFEKYLLTHHEAYVVVNNDCNNQNKPLVELTYPIFENSFYSTEEIKFSLCGKISITEEL